MLPIQVGWLKSNCASGGYKDFQALVHSMPISLLLMKMARNIIFVGDRLVEDQGHHRVQPLVLQDRPANQAVLLPAIHLGGPLTRLRLGRIGVDRV